MALLSYVPRLLSDPSTANSYPARHMVVALHGTASEPAAFTQLSRTLRSRGVALRAPFYGKRGTAGVQECAEEVASLIDGLCSPNHTTHPIGRIDIVGHSYGALVGLKALELVRPETAEKVHHLVGAGGAWRGTGRKAWLRPDWLVRGVLGDSFVELQRYREAPLAPPHIRVVSIVTDNDRAVPAWSSRWGEVIEVSGASHSALPKLTSEIVNALGLTEPARRTDS